jgi:mycofactocin precursor
MSEDLLLENTDNATPEDIAAEDAAGEALLESLLVEEVSIDGMCGVY